MADDRDVLQARQPLLGLLERLRGDVDQVDAGRAAGRLQRLGEHDQLLAAAAPELDDRGGSSSPSVGDDLPRVSVEQAALRARDAVPRQPADRLEQARAERVVEILRLELLRREREIAPDVGGEVGEQTGRGADDHVFLSKPGSQARRSPGARPGYRPAAMNLTPPF